MSNDGLPPLALTMGEPAGIGGEIAIKAWEARREAAVPPFFLIDDPSRLAGLAGRLDRELPLAEIETPEAAAAVFPRSLPVLPMALASEVAPGEPDKANAGAVLQSIETAVHLVRAGRAAAVVTNPINKEVLYAAGFSHPGHTEYLAELAGPGHTAVMMLACAELKVVPVTIHLPLIEAIGCLDRPRILHCGRVTAAALKRDFAIAAPRLAVAGLNPHAGESGTIGREEIDIIEPAVEALRAEGIDAASPAPADSLFHPAARARYDAVLCMYHDQALIPLKTIDFERGINITLGLPFIRTSPDHGTAFDIAGTGRANPASLVAALVTARRMAAARAAAAAPP
jgi:4-hydroxythreonine-4-phosphate dehydrogenase